MKMDIVPRFNAPLVLLILVSQLYIDVHGHSLLRTVFCSFWLLAADSGSTCFTIHPLANLGLLLYFQVPRTNNQVNFC